MELFQNHVEKKHMSKIVTDLLKAHPFCVYSCVYSCVLKGFQRPTLPMTKGTREWNVQPANFQMKTTHPALKYTRSDTRVRRDPPSSESQSC